MTPFLSENLPFRASDEDWQPHPFSQALTYVTSNQRIRAHLGIDGAIWDLAHPIPGTSSEPDPYPISQRASSPTAPVLAFRRDPSVHLGPACWFGLRFPEGDCVETIDRGYPHVAGYLDNTVPTALVSVGSLELTIRVLAPIAGHEDGVHRPPGLLYQVEVTNVGDTLSECDLLLRIAGHLYTLGDDRPVPDSTNQEAVSWDKERHSLTLSTPTLPPVTFMGDDQTTLLQDAETTLMRPCRLEPGETHLYTVWITVEPEEDSPNGTAVELESRSPRAWLQATYQYWRQVTGEVQTLSDSWLAEFLVRAAQESLGSMLVDKAGSIVGISEPSGTGARLHWSDVPWVAFPALFTDPQQYARLTAWYSASLIRASAGQPLDTQAHVFPAVMMGLLWRTYGSIPAVLQTKEVLKSIEELLDTARSKQDLHTGLFATDVCHGYQPLTPYELGTNVACWAAAHLWAQVLEGLEKPERAAVWRDRAEDLRAAIDEHFLSRGPGKGSWHYAGLKYVASYRLDPLHYYEHDALDVALAPLLGFCSRNSRPWVNTMQHLFSPYYQLVLSRNKTAVWWEPGNRRAYRQKHTNPSPLNRFPAAESGDDLETAILALQDRVALNGSLYNNQGRAFRELGAAYALLLAYGFGITIDAVTRTLTLAPRPLARVIHWVPGKVKSLPVSVTFSQSPHAVEVFLDNRTADCWAVRLESRFAPAFTLDEVWVDGNAASGEVVSEYPDAWQRVNVETDLEGGASCTISVRMKLTSHRKPLNDERVEVR